MIRKKRLHTKKIVLFFISCLVMASCSKKPGNTFIIESPEFNLENVPVYVDITNSILNSELKVNSSITMNSRRGVVPAQVEAINDSTKRVWWIANQKAGEPVKYRLKLDGGTPSYKLFSWEQVGSHSLRLSYGDQHVLQYEYPEFDSTDILSTHKAYHHLYAPGENYFITKGLGGTEPHHKGIFFGYNKVLINDSLVNTWAAFNGERVQHKEIVEEYDGPVMGGHVVRIIWKNQVGDPLIEEFREIRAYYQSREESLIEFTSTLYSLKEDTIYLRGDRQHAGVQFRADQFVADNPDGTTFMRPVKLGHLDNDVEIDESEMHNVPWDAMNFRLNNVEYTVAYMSHPSNPENAEMSERRYGRFGEYFPYDLTKENMLKVRYSFYVKAGEKPSPDLVEIKYDAFSKSTKIN